MVTKEELQGSRYQRNCWICGKIGHKSSECRLEVAGVDGEDSDCRKVEDNLSQKKPGKSAARGSFHTQSTSVMFSTGVGAGLAYQLAASVINIVDV